MKINSGAMLYDEQMSYDPVGNVSAVTTILPAGTDHQLFCYDEQNRLTWAGTTSGNPCGNSGATGSFGGASYTQSFAYDTLNRLMSGPLGSYSYGDSAHLHAATSVSSGSSQYTASYDAAGDMQCRAPSSSTTCSGTQTQTGQQLTWDVEGRLATWQNTTTTPTVTAKYLYDGEGNRVVQQVVDSTAGSATTTTTSYIGSLETATMTAVSGGPGSSSTTDYIPAGKVLAVASNGTLSYLATSYQGSVVAALDSTGAVGVTASQLYAPYGGMRYASGTMPTDYGYTGQRSDASTGLDYYGARYYDPTLGQFTSADTLTAGGLNRYGYVGGNPTTATDPSGHMDDENPDEGAATGTQGAPPGSFAAGVGGGGGLAAFFAWLFGEDEAASGAAAGSAVASTTAGDDTLVLNEGSNTTATIDDGGITFTDTQTGNSQFLDNSYFNDVQDPATETPGSHYWSELDQEANKADPPRTPTSTEGPSDNPSNPGNPGDAGGKGGTTGGSNGGGGSSNGGGKPVNSRGVPYPDVVDPRTGAPIPFPNGDIQEVPPELRVEWDNPKTGFVHRGEYIKDWYDRGYDTPTGGWNSYQLHHILPRRFGGTNDFWNLVPLTPEDHSLFTTWWRYYP